MIELPTNTPVMRKEQNASEWSRFFKAVYSACFSLYQSGTTAQRPTIGLWVGRPYFDTTLALPIWYDANVTTGWCDAAGNDV